MAKGEKAKKGASIADVVPTPAHMALSQLCQVGMMKHVVSTNLDGLHVRSGVPIDMLSELHGNAFKRNCLNCLKYYFMTPEMQKSKDSKMKELRETFKKNSCPDCKSPLHGTGVGFGSNLPQDEWNKAKNASEGCDLALVLGTSMRVAPACNLPEKSYKNKGHLVICNLQKTPYDKYASLVIHAQTDLVMQLLFKELNLDIPQMTPILLPPLKYTL
uniref:Regulatory protein SIR2 homolog 7 n=1 Tax=Arcella intermedia TaxID=1963864 RepID=A0A6B2LEL2_9EUKA